MEWKKISDRNFRAMPVVAHFQESGIRTGIAMWKERNKIRDNSALSAAKIE